MVKAQLQKLLKEKTAIIYKGFAEWVINLSIVGIMLTVLICRIFLCVSQIQTVEKFKLNNFTNFFPVCYFTKNIEELVQMLEIIMVSCLALNSLFAFYIEFFAQILLTFKYSLKYLFSFFFIYFLVVVAYASCCTIIYGSIIRKFNSLFTSITTMVLFINLDYSQINKMIEYYPTISYIIIFSYLFVVYLLLLNMLFVIFLDAYGKVRRKHVVTLLKYSIIWDGLLQFFLNWVIKIATILKIRNLLFKNI